MKAWRQGAAAFKREAIKQGRHEHGARYGRLLKALFGSSFKPIPSVLFQRIGIHAGILKAD